jgi:hypothetical protein
VRHDAAKEENRKERGENWDITDHIGSGGWTSKQVAFLHRGGGADQCLRPDQ